MIQDKSFRCMGERERELEREREREREGREREREREKGGERKRKTLEKDMSESQLISPAAASRAARRETMAHTALMMARSFGLSVRTPVNVMKIVCIVDGR